MTDDEADAANWAPPTVDAPTEQPVEAGRANGGSPSFFDGRRLGWTVTVLVLVAGLVVLFTVLVRLGGSQDEVATTTTSSTSELDPTTTTAAVASTTAVTAPTTATSADSTAPDPTVASEPVEVECEPLDFREGVEVDGLTVPCDVGELVVEAEPSGGWDRTISAVELPTGWTVELLWARYDGEHGVGECEHAELVGEPFGGCGFLILEEPGRNFSVADRENDSIQTVRVLRAVPGQPVMLGFCNLDERCRDGNDNGILRLTYRP